MDSSPPACFHVRAHHRPLTDLEESWKPGHGAQAVFGRHFSSGSGTELLHIEIPKKLILVKILESMGPVVPRFNCKKIQEDSFQMEILFDVPASYSETGNVDPVDITGSVSPTAEDAAANAFSQAFKYLAETHKIFVMDYSGRLAEEYKEQLPGIYPTALKICKAVETMADLWGRGLYRVGTLVSMLRGKVLVDSNNGNLSDSGKVYEVLQTHLTSIGKKSREQHTAMLEVFKKHDAVRQECIGADHNLGEKVVNKIIRFSEKDLLAYLLNYMGLPEVEYCNKPTGRFVYTGYATIDLPLVENIPCSGKTVIDGKAKNTADSCILFSFLSVMPTG
ncbi:hypothetical protein ACP70R_046220 [Stipagrostis hirtigluma subsp. patula]